MTTAERIQRAIERAAQTDELIRYTFDESAHPRKGEGPGGGQFTAGAGGSSSAADDDDDGSTFRLKPRADAAAEVGMPQSQPAPVPSPVPTPAAPAADQQPAAPADDDDGGFRLKPREGVAEAVGMPQIAALAPTPAPAPDPVPPQDPPPVPAPQPPPLPQQPPPLPVAPSPQPSDDGGGAFRFQPRPDAPASVGMPQLEAKARAATTKAPPAAQVAAAAPAAAADVQAKATPEQKAKAGSKAGELAKRLLTSRGAKNTAKVLGFMLAGGLGIAAGAAILGIFPYLVAAMAMQSMRGRYSADDAQELDDAAAQEEAMKLLLEFAEPVEPQQQYAARLARCLAADAVTDELLELYARKRVADPDQGSLFGAGHPTWKPEEHPRDKETGEFVDKETATAQRLDPAGEARKAAVVPVERHATHVDDESHDDAPEPPDLDGRRAELVAKRDRLEAQQQRHNGVVSGGAGSELATHFPLGAGAAGPNTAKLNRAKAASIDRAIESAKASIELDGKIRHLDRKIKEIDSGEEADRIAKASANRAKRDGSKAKSPDSDRAVDNNLRSLGRHTFDDGSKVSIEWNELDRVGTATLLTADGRTITRKAAEPHVQSLYVAARELAKEHAKNETQPIMERPKAAPDNPPDADIPAPPRRESTKPATAPKLTRGMAADGWDPKKAVEHAETLRRDAHGLKVLSDSGVKTAVNARAAAKMRARADEFDPQTPETKRKLWADYQKDAAAHNRRRIQDGLDPVKHLEYWDGANYIPENPEPDRLTSNGQSIGGVWHQNGKWIVGRGNIDAARKLVDTRASAVANARYEANHPAHGETGRESFRKAAQDYQRDVDDLREQIAEHDAAEKVRKATPLHERTRAEVVRDIFHAARAHLKAPDTTEPLPSGTFQSAPKVANPAHLRLTRDRDAIEYAKRIDDKGEPIGWAPVHDGAIEKWAARLRVPSPDEHTKAKMKHEDTARYSFVERIDRLIAGQAIIDGLERYQEVWRTIGGSAGEGGAHHGGRKVLLDSETGEIKGGAVPKGAVGTKVGDIGKRLNELRQSSLFNTGVPADAGRRGKPSETARASQGSLFDAGKPQPKAEPPKPPPEPPKPTRTEQDIATESRGIRSVPVTSLSVDPARFQYKLGKDATTGAGDELKEVSTFNPTLAGLILAWKDPTDGKDYVINGHHRYELASRAGADKIDVRFIQADDDKHARAIGALANIAEGRGTATDAAKFMRDMKQTPEDFKKEGISLRESVAKNAITLSKLDDQLFGKLTQGVMSESRALAFAGGLEPEDQRRLFNIVQKSIDKGRKVLDSDVVEMAKEMAEAGREKTTEQNLFGSFESAESTFLERNQLKSAIRQELATDATVFGFGANEKKAKRLQQGADGKNVIDVDANKRLAQQADELKFAFDKLAGRKGPFSDALKEAASELFKKPTRRKQISDKLIERVRPILRAELGGGSGLQEGGGGVARDPGGREGAQGGGGSDAHSRPAADEPVEEKPYNDPNQKGFFSARLAHVLRMAAVTDEFERYARRKADAEQGGLFGGWDESKHPRDAKGEFSTGAGSGKAPEQGSLFAPPPSPAAAPATPAVAPAASTATTAPAKPAHQFSDHEPDVGDLIIFPASSEDLDQGSLFGGAVKAKKKVRVTAVQRSLFGGHSNEVIGSDGEVYQVQRFKSGDEGKTRGWMVIPSEPKVMKAPPPGPGSMRRPMETPSLFAARFRRMLAYASATDELTRYEGGGFPPPAAGDHWVTLEADRKVLLDKGGNIVGGDVPRTWQGKDVRQAHIPSQSPPTPQPREGVAEPTPAPAPTPVPPQSAMAIPPPPSPTKVAAALPPPTTRENMETIALSAREAMEEVVGNPENQCIACAWAIKTLYPQAEIYDGTFNGQPHTLAKLGGKFIDVTADQFGDDSDAVQLLDADDMDSRYGRYWRVDHKHKQDAFAPKWNTQTKIEAVMKSKLLEPAQL